jgi:uncharacterized protein with PQ loop repeat
MSNNNDNLSYIFGIISLIFYSIVYIPQFHLIYKLKNSSGISIWTILLWTQADILSLVGTIVLQLHKSIIIIGWYHYIVGVAMIMWILYYRKYNTILETLGVIIFLLINTSVCIYLNITINESHDTIGESIGWLTMGLYLLGRFPQIWMNYKLKSTEGLSILMYVFTMLGNITYIIIIILEPENNMPWLVNGITTILLDILVVGQHYYYK